MRQIYGDKERYGTGGGSVSKWKQSMTVGRNVKLTVTRNGGKAADGRGRSMNSRSWSVGYIMLLQGQIARRYPWNSWKPEVFTAEWQDGILHYGMVPEWDRKGRAWKPEYLRERLQHLLEQWECESCYLHPEITGLLDLEERIPPSPLIRQVFGWIGGWEQLYYIAPEEHIWDGEDRIQEHLEPYLSRINHVTLITDRKKDYEGFLSYLYEEYGIPSVCLSHPDPGRQKQRKTVILNLRKKNWITDQDIQNLPDHAACLDCWSQESIRTELAVERPDIHYYSVVNFLDMVREKWV